MAALGGRALFLLLIFNIFLRINSSERHGFPSKTLNIYNDHEIKKRSVSVFNKEVDENLTGDETSFINRHKRDVEPSSKSDNITTKVTSLDDSHQQLMVHWVGEGSNVIICLAKDTSPHPPHKPTPSSVYISYDYGDSFVNKTDMFKMNENGTIASLDKFYTHPKFNSYFVFRDSINKLLFVTTDMGKTLKKIRVLFTPSDLSFHVDNPDIFLIHDQEDQQRTLYITKDYGVSFQPLQKFVKSFFWSSGVDVPLRLYVERMEPSETSTVLFSTGLFHSTSNMTVLIEGVQDFQVRGNFLFATKKNNDKNNLELYVSYRRGPFVRADFETELSILGLHVSDVTDFRLMVSAVHTDSLTHLYVSESTKDFTDIKFELSLESIFCYMPNSTWTDSWISAVAEEAFADLYRVEGVRGIYIASKVSLRKTTGYISPEHLVSVISFDHGNTWGPITAPKFDDDGHAINCEKDCSLHLSQKFSQLYPVTRSVSILSSKSAPGIIMAAGVVGKSLKGHPSVFISRDAGLTWNQVLKDYYFFNFGDHGGVMVAVKYFKTKGETREILYTTDEGEKWLSHKFNNVELRVYGLMTEPGENTTVFTMFGSNTAVHKWLIIKVDLKNAFSYNCTTDDYKSWAPGGLAGQSAMPCILGSKDTYQRRIPHANCFNGKDYDRPIKQEICECDNRDFECDFGFIKNGLPSHCIRNKSSNIDPYAIPSSCAPGKFYNRTKGYRKIEGDVCFDGFDYTYLPDTLPCPFGEKKEFLVMAIRDKIARIDLENNNLEIFPVQGLKSVIAIEFDLKNNCLYWADIVNDTIGRQCLSSGEYYPEMLVESDLASVEGMSFDWISNLLYFVDGMRAKIEVVRTDNNIYGRMRKTILNNSTLTKPRGIAVHPMAGYMFWTDWEPNMPSVSRANLDGSDVKRLFTKPDVVWPNGISIDHIAERIYWVDAKEDYIASADLNGLMFKKILSHEERATHPFAVAIFKDNMYWNDWKTTSVFKADKDHGIKIEPIVTDLLGLMDLKVYAHSIQEGKNACSNNTCSHICVGMPKNKFACLCPDGMDKINDKCLCPGGAVPTNNTCPKVSNTCRVDHFTCGNGMCIPGNRHCDGEDDCGDNSDERDCKINSCGTNMFACSDGACIPHYWRCDSDRDCKDGSDEVGCKYAECPKNDFKCDNGRCISERWKCDGEDDCRDGSDEKNCDVKKNVTCKPGEFKCKSTGACIPELWRCDSENDCPDSSDETSCRNTTCQSWMFQCNDGHCIYSTWQCDGNDDCHDGSDELNCTTSAPVTQRPIHYLPTNSCLDWMFLCGNNKCIAYWWKCDGVNDCGDNSDEIGCGTPKLPTTPILTTPSPTKQAKCVDREYMCNNGDCIPQSWVCDGSQDCQSGEDEQHCPDGKRMCPGDSFRCQMDGSCVPFSVVCNNVPDCPDGSDEQGCTKENNHPSDPIPTDCNIGYFSCDVGKCIALAKVCDSEQDCYDGSDEQNCSNYTRVYQILQMGVDERSVNSTSFLLYWWVPMPQNIKFEFMPSYSKIAHAPFNLWTNASSWIEDSEYRFTNLTAYTSYNTTVFVRVKDTKVSFPPAKYFNATTGEGVPSSPLNFTVKQINGSNFRVTWNPPEFPAGVIRSYVIMSTPPLPPIHKQVAAPATSYDFDGVFDDGVVYTFWIKAKNSLHESNDSQVVNIKYDGTSNIEKISDLKIDDVTENTVSLSWRKISNVDKYNVLALLPHPYPKQDSVLTNVNKITLDNLCPNCEYTIYVNGVKKEYHGAPQTIVVTTKGTRLPQIGNVEGRLLKGNAAKIYWDSPIDTRKVQWEYGVYYGRTVEELFEKPKLTTRNCTATIKDLKPCESYLFAVGVVGPLGPGPLGGHLTSLQTPFDPAAPPRDLTAELRGDDEHLQILLTWKPSCEVFIDPVAYKLNIRELTLNKTTRFALYPSTNLSLHHLVEPLMYGARYNICVETYNTSESTGYETAPQLCIETAAPALPIPHQLQIWPESNGSFVLTWKEVELPKPIKHLKYEYVVLVDMGREMIVDRAAKHIAAGSPWVLDNAMEGEIYSIAVRVRTEQGMMSDLSEVQSTQVSIGSWTQMLQSSTGLWVTIPLVLIALGLCSALAVIIFRHRRLQNSFTRFANSHYDTRTGATTIGDGLDDDDGPEIRRFSDDEPLVMA